MPTEKAEGELWKEAERRERGEHFLKMRLYKLVTIVERKGK